MSVLATLGTIAAAITAIGVIVGAAVAVARKTEPLWQMAEDWRGERERRGPGGVLVAPARLSVMERLAAQESGQAELRVEVAELRKELHPNGGSSARDAIDRLEVLVRDLQREMRARRDPAPDRPVIEASGVGFQAERAEL